MIAHVSGIVTSVAPDGAVVEVGGVGLQIQCAPATLAELRLGHHARLATSLVVREDSLTLFGFADDDERQVFELVQTVSGVGPRLAQAMLGVHAPNELRRIVASEDLAALAQVPGIGRKGAQRIVLELKDKLGAPMGGVVDLRTTEPKAQWQEQVHGALLGLGWSPREADDAVTAGAADLADADTAEANGVEAGDVAGLLRSALRMLGPR
ncbi:MAG TPA: Holliday junction branch migration protein RuvA [Actinomycetes bacterium]|nr:Holliday junction branch migration protein RuvA [Actinomycetes bacterium]